MGETFTFKVPGKLVINGSYIVLEGQKCRTVAINKYLRGCVERQKSPKTRIVVNIWGRDKLTCHYAEDHLTCDSSNPGTYYLFRIIEVFYNLTKLIPEDDLVIDLQFDEGFFVGQNPVIKTGIGSSACILVAIVYSLLKSDQKRFIRFVKDPNFEGWPPHPEFDDDLCSHLTYLDLNADATKHFMPIVFAVHRTLNSKASGCDVASCSVGTILFDTKKYSLLSGIPKHILLGSFGKSTSTREMLAAIDLAEPTWKDISEVNNKINSSEGNQKELYRELVELTRKANKRILPDAQYKILKETFKFDIWGAGISGAGGEDCVWVIADDYTKVKEYWERVFDHVILAEITYKGIVIM